MAKLLLFGDQLSQFGELEFSQYQASVKFPTILEWVPSSYYKLIDWCILDSFSHRTDCLKVQLKFQLISILLKMIEQEVLLHLGDIPSAPKRIDIWEALTGVPGAQRTEAPKPPPSSEVLQRINALHMQAKSSGATMKEVREYD